MIHTKITKTTAEKASYQGSGNSRQIIWDSAVTGFGLRVYPSGKKSFVIAYRHHNRQRLMTIGDFGTHTVDQARTIAKVELGKVAADTDPLRDKQLRARGERVKDFCAAYVERHAKPKKKSWKDDQGMIDNRILPAWGSLQMKAIVREDVAALHRKIGAEKKPYAANRVLALISKMFELAEVWGYVPEGHPNPARKIEKFKERKRDRWVTPDELPALAQAIDDEPNTVARDALWLYLLTGLRKNELLSLKWSNINIDRRELHLDDSKSGRAHYLPLSTAALTQLDAITPVKDNPYVFPGRDDGHHLVNIDKAWRRVRKAAGIEDVRLHDLRRTVGSWLAQSGNSLHLIGRVLNHSNVSTTQVYARFGQDSIRQALDQHGEQIMGVAGKRVSG